MLANHFIFVNTLFRTIEIKGVVVSYEMKAKQMETWMEVEGCICFN